MDFWSKLGIIDWNGEVWHFVVRLLLAALAGYLIGLERMYRAKEAGVRTQTILCVTACLLMILSKYAFYDLVAVGVDYDSSRVASTIISGLSFLGAGMLFFKRESLRGLTTAAGICLTASIGMAFGAGMIVTGAVTTVLTLIIQLFMHAPLKAFTSKHMVEIRVQFEITDGYIEEFKSRYNVGHFTKFRTSRENDKMIADVVFYTANRVTSEELFDKMSKDANITYFEKVEEN